MADGQKKGLAIASLILGILSMVMFGILSAIPGIITGHMARSRASKDPVNYGGAGMALAGLILSYLAILISVGFFFWIMNNPEFAQMMQDMQSGAIAPPAAE